MEAVRGVGSQGQVGGHGVGVGVGGQGVGRLDAQGDLQAPSGGRGGRGDGGGGGGEEERGHGQLIGVGDRVRLGSVGLKRGPV